MPKKRKKAKKHKKKPVGSGQHADGPCAVTSSDADKAFVASFLGSSGLFAFDSGSEPFLSTDPVLQQGTDANSLLKQAVALVGAPCGAVQARSVAERDAENLLRQCIQSCTNVEPAPDKASVGPHSQDTPDYVLGAARLELAQLKTKQGDTQAAQLLLDQVWTNTRMPTCIRYQARCCTAKLLQRQAGNQDDMAGVEEHYRAAVTLLTSNQYCQIEVDHGIKARRELAMLCCQDGRDEEACSLLRALGHTHRLSPAVLHYRQPTEDLPPAPEAARYVVAVDNALSPAMLDRMQQAFAAESLFWSQHCYGRIGYFSYRLSLKSAARTCIDQVVLHIQRIVMQSFPAVAEAEVAEWWAHSRPHADGHQLHYDSDDEGLGGVRNPIVSCVVYLSQGLGGPTLVTDQLLGEKLATRGWMVQPKVNRLCMFDGRYLHGVIPGRGPSPQSLCRRTTFMIAFWRSLNTRKVNEDGHPGASQPFPRPDSSYTWHKQLSLHKDTGFSACVPVVVSPVAIEHVWTGVDLQPLGDNTPSYQACFQGF